MYPAINTWAASGMGVQAALNPDATHPTRGKAHDYWYQKTCISKRLGTHLW